MSAQSIECQIAKGQIGRYLGGAAFSREAVTQLEAHIQGCAHCKAFLGDRKSELLSQIAPVGETVEPEEAAEAPKPQPTISAPAETPAPPQAKTLWQRAVGLFITEQSASPAPAAPSGKPLTKSVAYSCALAAVLGVMSLASRNLDRITGKKVLDTATVVQELKPSGARPAATAAPKPVAATNVTEQRAAQPLTPSQYRVRTSVPSLRLPSMTPLSKNKPILKKPAPKPLVSKAVMPQAATKKVAKKPKQASHAKPKVAKPTLKKAARPKKALAKARKPLTPKKPAKPQTFFATKRSAKALGAQANRPKPTRSAIRIYDEFGNPIR